jgi:flagellar protein FlaG
MLDSIKGTAIRQIDVGTHVKESGRGADSQQDNLSVDKKHQEAAAKNAEKDVAKAVEELNKAVEALNIGRKFEIEDDLEEVVVKIMDKKEGEVIRQIPSEEAIKLEKNIKQMLGMFFDSTM